MAPANATATKKAAQPSRKGKKAWRKNTDVADVEETLDELRNEERLGGKLHEKKDEDLFFTDKKGDEEVRQKLRSRPLRIDEILRPQSAFDGIRSRPTAPSAKPAPSSTGKARAISKTLVAQVEELSKRKREAGLGPGSAKATKKRRLDEKRAELRKAKGGFDLWDVQDKTAVTHEEEYLEPVKVKPVKKPKLPDQRPAAIRAVEPTHPGISYNPTFDDHQSALQAAVDEEELKEKRKEETAKKMSYPAELDELDEETFFDDSDEEEEDATPDLDVTEADGAISEAETDGRSFTKPVAVESRKTKVQRNKEARLAEKRREEEKLAEEKKLLKQLNRLGEIKKQVSKEEQKRLRKLEERAKAEAEAAATLTRRVGPHEFKPAPMDIQLTEDLADSLRELKPEGNLFQDRFLSLQKRSLIETRVPVSKRLKYKRKEMESHDYKRFK
ncbi:hypothetical protein HDV00_010271 [Rhizophlyctis rosea]|nr:hypothetical protein HDV00_010271 [Rhizophlyctis rosea]